MQAMERGESPVLGQASGVYREKPVSPMLRRHFVSAWFHQKPSGVARQTGVVRDACPDLIWFGGNLLVAGPDRQVRFESVPPGATVVGMRFQPGAVAVWLGVPASAIVGARIQLDCFCKGQAQELIDLIGGHSGSSSCCKAARSGPRKNYRRSCVTGQLFQDNS